MRPSLFLAAALLLPACVLPQGKPAPAAQGNPITGAAISVQSLDAPKAALPKAGASKAAAALPEPVAGQVDASLDAITAAGRTGPADEEAKAKPQAPEEAPEEAADKEAAQTDDGPPHAADPQSPEEIRCLKSGGLWATAGDTGAKACVLRTRDGGKACSKQTQCEGLCLARSRSCAPITPMFGCNEILQADGREVTLCLD